MVAQNGFRQFSLFEIIVPFNYNSSYIHRQFGFQCTIPAFVPLCGNPICTSITIYRNCRYSFGFFSLLVFLLGFFQQFHLSLDIHICILFLVLSSQSQHSPYNWSVKLIHSQYLYVKMHLSCEPSGSRGTQNVPLAQVLTEGPHFPDRLPTENSLGSNNTRHPLWGVSNYTHKHSNKVSKYNCITKNSWKGKRHKTLPHEGKQ